MQRSANGVGFTTTLLPRTPSHRTVFPVWQPGGGFGMKELEGAADMVMLPDPTTFRALPWAPHSGWMLCELYFADGRSMPFCTRQAAPGRSPRWLERGYDFVAGLEVEFHLFKLLEGETRHRRRRPAGRVPPEVALLNQGYQYLTEQRYDEMDPILEILRTNLVDLGLPLRTLEVEFGPSQVEFTFRTGTGLDPADTMVLFRSATKQIAQRNGFHASFMCRPKLANVMSSGWHLHQSLTDRKTHANAFADGAEPLSATGRHYMAGLLDHARAAAAFSTPTLNGYKRYRPFSLAPDRAIWGPRQSRRHGTGAGRTRRSRDSSRKPRRRARRQSLSLHGEPDRVRPRRSGARARSRPLGRQALRNHGTSAAAVAPRGAVRAR
jgi:glutamine synthetase